MRDVRLMKKTVGNVLKVKAGRRLRSLKECAQFIEAGAERIGTGAAVKIAEDQAFEGGY